MRIRDWSSGVCSSVLMNMQLVEPLRELFKDEVRMLGRELGLPESLVGRHPFPGPGLAIRIPGDITREKLDLLREVDAVYLDEIRRSGLSDQIWRSEVRRVGTECVLTGKTRWAP